MRLRHEFYLLLVPRDHKHGQRIWPAKTKVKVQCAKCWKSFRKPFYEQLLLHVFSHRFPMKLIRICHFQTKHESEKLTTQRFRGAGTLFSPYVRHKIPYHIRRAHLAKVRRHTGGRRLWSGGAAFMFSRIVYLFWNSNFMLTWVVYVRHGCWWLSACQTQSTRENTVLFAPQRHAHVGGKLVSIFCRLPANLKVLTEYRAT